MMCILKPDENDLPRWSLFDENCLVRHYDGQLTRQKVLEQIWQDFGEDIAVSIGYGE